MLDWVEAIKTMKAFDSQYHKIDISMMYLWYIAGVLAFVFAPNVPAGGIMLIVAAAFSWFSLNSKPRKLNQKYYRSWPYAMFVFRYRITLEYNREINVAEILNFCEKNFPTTKWMYNRQILYIWNRRMLVAMKIRFPELVDAYLTTLVPNEK